MTIFEKYWEQLHIEQIGIILISKTVSLITLFILFLILRHLAEFFFNKMVIKSLALTGQSEARKKTIARLMHNCLNYTLYFFLIYSILNIVGVPISSLLAGAGIAGLAIGLGAQGFLSDVVNGFFILLENQYEVGDSVVIGNVSGKITSLGLRTTQVRDSDGTLHFIPNRSITVVSNQSRGNMRSRIDIPIYAHIDLEKVAEVIESVNTSELPKFPQVVEAPTIVGPIYTSNGQLVFRVDLVVNNGQQNSIYSTFYGLYQAALTEADIKLPTPHLNNL
ncbi:mechanosensitive ion channel family protein [Streptococcus sciuri]|uniref:Mechanosensitive ion channel family protein n=1 Tax=Streptococcus sciuri TaxID=2973939 RepID=A0ABT2F7H2_9STRE|nr:mechanosensitive ion channel family protein [Streptococcus sciuri]MCS4488143.1 mechanosensitive ion channel family protein [Streptococcus sciuri]